MMSGHHPSTGGHARFHDRFAWVLLLVCAIAAWMGLGRLHAFQDSDSLLPVLVSVQRWTPFFWGQDRFGMLVPLLVMPIHHPLGNLIVQGWVMTVAALLAPFLVARHLGIPHWFAVGALANALIVLLLSRYLQFAWLVAQPYALSITLATLGMVAAERSAIPGSLAAAVLMLLAHWINLGICILVFPLLLVRGRASVRGLVAAVVGLAGGAAMQTLGVPQTIEGLVDVPDWPHAWFMPRQDDVGPNHASGLVGYHRCRRACRGGSFDSNRISEGRVVARGGCSRRMYLLVGRRNVQARPGE
jgi:hypothetical protein